MTSHRFRKLCLSNSAVFTALSFQVGPTTAGAGIDGAACGSSGQAQGAVTIPGAKIFCKSKLAPTTSQVTMLLSLWPRDPSGYTTITPQLQPALVQVLSSTTIKSKNA